MIEIPISRQFFVVLKYFNMDDHIPSVSTIEEDKQTVSQSKESWEI